MKTNKKITEWIFCHILSDHDWTSASMEGKKPTQLQIRNRVNGFWDYSRMYCRHCGKMSKLNKV